MPLPRTMPDQNQVRAHFPALSQATVFLENAGGSQVADFVADRMHRYLTQSYVQRGAGYALSQECTATVADAHEFARTLVNAGDGQVLRPGQRIILAETGMASPRPWRNRPGPTPFLFPAMTCPTSSNPVVRITKAARPCWGWETISSF